MEPTCKLNAQFLDNETKSTTHRRVVNTTAKVVQELKALAIETKQELQEQLLGFETKLQTFASVAMLFEHVRQFQVASS